MKVKKIRIRSLEDSLKDFATAYHKVSQRKLVRKRGGIFFANMEAVRKVLTENRIRLMKVIKQKKPASLYELAKLAHRDLKNVSQDIAFLEDLGLVDLRSPQGVRNQRKPVLLSDRFSVEFAI